MKEENDRFSTFDYLDSQRIKEAFFAERSGQKKINKQAKRHPKKPGKKRIISEPKKPDSLTIAVPNSQNCLPKPTQPNLESNLLTKLKDDVVVNELKPDTIEAKISPAQVPRAINNEILKKRNKTLFIPILITTAVTLGWLIFYLFSNYSFFIIPKNSHLDKNSISLLKNGSTFIETILNNESKAVKNNRPILLTINSNQKNGIRLALPNALNFNENKLILRFKNGDLPNKLNIVLRDKNFFSNALDPIIIESIASDNKNEIVEISIASKSAQIQPVNLLQIKQLTIYFFAADSNAKNIVIRDVVLENINKKT